MSFDGHYPLVYSELSQLFQIQICGHNNSDKIRVWPLKKPLMASFLTVIVAIVRCMMRVLCYKLFFGCYRLAC